MLRVAKARDASQLLAALALHREPALVVAYADAAGEGGVKLAGALPRRRMATGLQPVPSRDPVFSGSGARDVCDGGSGAERAGLELLHDWDRDSGRRSAGAAVFHVFVAHLLRELYE